MSAARPPLVHLCEAEPGQLADFFALLAGRERSLTREGRPYYHCRFRDARRSASFMAWADDRWFAPCEAEWQEGRFYKLRAVYQEHERYGPQIDLHKIRPVTDADRADGFDESQFIESSRHAPADLLAGLRAAADSRIDAPLRALVVGLLEAHAEALSRLPATRAGAYPYRGGLLEHTAGVTRIALNLADHYADWLPGLRPQLDVGLVAAGAMLHEIGRVLELDEGVSPGVTVAGRLFGPHVLGRDLIRDAARTHAGIAPGRLRLLEHLVLAAGGEEALAPEAILLRHADALDLEMALAARVLERGTGPGPFTERDPVLGRALLKAR